MSEWWPSGQARKKRGGVGSGGAINVKVNMPYRAVKCKGYYNKINNAKISREAAIVKIKSNIRNLCAAQCGHIAGGEKGVSRIREKGESVPRARSEALHATREGIKRNQRGIPLPTWLSVLPPAPRPPRWLSLPGSDSSSRFSQYFVVFLWAFFSLVSVSSSCCCSSFLFFWSAAR